ncbi:MAG: hypothetical protein AB1405_06885, partial [Bdellovibrionota bacterium]
AVLPAVLAQGGSRVDLLVYGGNGDRADSLPSYIEFFSPGEVWDLSWEILPRRWPGEGKNPRVELIPKDRWRTQGTSGWALLVSEGESRFLLDGAPGKWPAGWAERWREKPLAVQLSPRTLSSASSRWLLARARPEVLLLPKRRSAREFSFGGEIVAGGWARIEMSREGIEVERAE